MFFKVHVLHIDEGCAVYGWDEEFHQKQIQMIKQLCEERYKFTYTILPLESIFDANTKDLDMKVPTKEEK